MKRLSMALACLIILAALGCGQSADDPNATSESLKVDGPPPTQVAAKAVDEVTGSEMAITVSDAGEEPETEAPAPGSDLPETVAIIEGEKITGEEFGQLIGHAEMRMGTQGMPGKLTDGQRSDLLDRLVNDKVLTVLATRAKIEVTDAEVDEMLEEQKKRLPSPEMFQQSLEQLGKTEAEFKVLLRDSVMKQKYVEEATKELAVTEEELTAEYETLKESGRLERPESVDVSHILVKVDGKDEEVWTKGKETIDAARKRIVDDKEEFAAVAKEVSDDPGSAERGGSYPNTGRGKMVPEFEERMFSQEIGEISEPFRTQYGWHILTVTAKNEAGTMSQEEISEDLKGYLEGRKRQEAVEKLIADNRAKMKVEILLPTPAPPATAAAAPAAPVSDAAADAPKEDAAPEAPKEDASSPQEAPASSEGSASDEKEADAS